MQHFILDNFITLTVFALLFYKVIKLKIEYFPTKMRYSEDAMNNYIDHKLSRRYERETKRFLPQNRLYKFNEGEGADTSRIQRPERNFGDS